MLLLRRQLFKCVLRMIPDERVSNILLQLEEIKMRSVKAGQLAALEQQYMWAEIHEIRSVLSPLFPY